MTLSLPRSQSTAPPPGAVGLGGVLEGAGSTGVIARLSFCKAAGSTFKCTSFGLGSLGMELNLGPGVWFRCGKQLCPMPPSLCGKVC